MSHKIERVFAVSEIFAVFDQPQNSPKGKPYMRCIFKDDQGFPVIVCMTTNLAEMIGGAAAGVRERYEEAN